MADNEYRVWDCKIVVPSGEELPQGFDSPPRIAAIKAVEAAGVEVVSCFSGWAGSLTPTQLELVRETTARLAGR